MVERDNTISEVEPTNTGGPAYEPEEIKTFAEAIHSGDQCRLPNRKFCSISIGFNLSY